MVWISHTLLLGVRMLLLMLACMGDAPIKDIPHETGEPPVHESDSIENKAPVINIIAPQDGQTVAASFHLSLLVQDDWDSADQLSVEINESGSILTGGFVSSDGTFDVELGPFTEGEHRLSLLARDHTVYWLIRSLTFLPAMLGMAYWRVRVPKAPQNFHA